MSTLEDHWHEIDPILNAALEMPPADRAGYVARACGDDAELCALIMRVLARSTADTPPAFEGPLWDAFAEGIADTPPGAEITPGKDLPAAPPPEQGTVIDRYRLLEVVGRGGMSVVYKAERTDGAFDAPVALKLATLVGLDTPARARFERERRILAELRHPHIAQILDGGESETGQPYLVMELVDGEPIDAYADAKGLGVHERLVLFAEVARAVQHAHRNLVVHRDIKPQNVLIDREGRVKLLDFGIAALVDERAPDVTVTRAHARPMTPAFASPEQLSGAPVTTVSDVYQLGLLLYRLLTGCPPYRPETQDTDAWRRAVTETEPARPSVVVARDDVLSRLAPDRGAVAEVAARRGTTPARLSRTLRGDLETIVLMALRKEPDRRYASAQQLADDIDRYLEGRPVSAQPDTAGYRLRKFVARNRVGVGVAALLVVLLMAFTTMLALQSRVITEERDRARREAETAQRVTGFLLDIFRDSAPVEGSTVDVRALDVVNRAAERIEQDLTDDPIVRARVMAAIGSLYSRFGEEVRGRPLLREAVDVLARDKAMNAVPWAFAVSELAALEIEDGYTPEEAAALEEVVDIYRREFGDGTIETISAIYQLGTAKLWTGGHAGARALFDEAIAAFEVLEPMPSVEWLALASSISIVRGARGQIDEAIALLDEAYPLARQMNHTPALFGITGQLAELHAAKNDIDLLERYAHEYLDYAQQTFGADNSNMAPALKLIGEAAHARGRYGEAEEAFERMQELSTREHAAMGQNAATSLSLVELLVDDGRPEEALAIVDTSLATIVDLFGYQTSLTASARHQRARAWLDLGETAKADTTLRALLDYHAMGVRRVHSSGGARGHAEALETFGRLQLATGHPDSARTVLARAVEVMEGTAAEDFWKLARVRGAYGLALLEAGDVAAAREALEAAHRVLAGRGDRYEREVEAARRALNGR